jgi:hypothetical protein
MTVVMIEVVTAVEIEAAIVAATVRNTVDAVVADALDGAAGAADVVVAAAVVAAVSVPAARAIFLHPNTLRRKVNHAATIAAAIVVIEVVIGDAAAILVAADTIADHGATSIIAAENRAVPLHPHPRIPLKNLSYFPANRSPSTAAVRHPNQSPQRP